MKNLHSSCFAYPSLRKFPIHTKENLLGSYGAYKVQRDGFSPEARKDIEGSFTKAAAYYGVELDPLEEPKEERQLLMFKGAAEAVDMHEIRTLKELDQAVDFILDKRASTTRESLCEPAKYCLWVAANTNRDLNTDKMRKIARIAGIGVGDRDEIQHELERRGVDNELDKASGEALRKFANELKSLSDEDFYKEDNLNTVCRVMDECDFMYGNQHKHASEGYPEDVVFKDTMDDLIKQASDLYYVPGLEATLSKKATLERKDAINGFLERLYGEKSELDGDALLNKMASLDRTTAEALLEVIE